MTEIVLATVLLTLVVLTLTLLVMGARGIFQPARPVEITVNGKTRINATTGAKLLSILNGANVPVPSACAGAGTCGLCRVRIPEGGGDPLPTETARLGVNDIHSGLRLACQVVVRDALAVEVPEDMLAAERWQCTVLSNTMLAPLIKEIVLALPAGTGFSFRAGAFVQITAPPHALDFATVEVDASCAASWDKFGWRRLKVASDEPASRAYSIANRPADTEQGRLVLNVRLAVPSPGAADDASPGIVSSYLFGARAGAKILASGPFGDFHVQDTGREMILIGGGVGMAPLRCIIFDELERKQTRRKMSFWYGARSSADVFYAGEFAALAERHANFAWTVALSDPDPRAGAWPGPVGFIHEVLYRDCLKDHPAPEDCEFYLCGPPLMIQAVMAVLEDVGVGSESIYFDDFGG
ncbi:MAG: NADH:ubiquinone reductase (Na(+)-transporting) subunit F [Burkholderiaceae bacterium]